jgi:hypothetical protein
MSLPDQTNPQTFTTSRLDDRNITVTDGLSADARQYHPGRPIRYLPSPLNMKNVRLVGPDGHPISNEDYGLYMYRRPYYTTGK